MQCFNELFSSCVAFVKKNKSTPFLSPNDAAENIFNPTLPHFLSPPLPKPIWHLSTFHLQVQSESMCCENKVMSGTHLYPVCCDILGFAFFSRNTWAWWGGIKQIWVRILSPAFTTDVNLGGSLNLPDPVSSSVKLSWTIKPNCWPFQVGRDSDKCWDRRERVILKIHRE